MLFQRARDGDALGWMGIAAFALSALPAWSWLGPVPFVFPPRIASSKVLPCFLQGEQRPPGNS